MDEDKLKKVQDDIDKNIVAPAKAFLDTIKVEDVAGIPTVKQTFVMFAFVDGQPQPPITTGVDPDMLSLMAKDMCRVMIYRDKVNKINKTVPDQQMRERLLKLLEKETFEG